ncbi:hypothetical protein IWW39_002566 [Coemansia spiralis]|uniref:Phospholipase n=1 Tax=Coemansia spiralis TaxID=417178 RepID=A0A9W8GKP8_9FUNG|nr:hypothetical protein IWW39_002566 [Coemansia spiralis]
MVVLFDEPASNPVAKSRSKALEPTDDPPTDGVRASVDEVPVSPLVAASTMGEQYPSNRLSYAHRRSVSGWDRLFSNMSQRSETHADQHNHESSGNQEGVEFRVPGIGEDSLAHDDVQYVYEYDEHYPEHSDDAFSHNMNGVHSSNYDTLSVPGRDRANTGVSSTGSGLQYDHNAVASTTALSPAYEQPETLEPKAVAPSSVANASRKRAETTEGFYNHQGASERSIRFADAEGGQGQGQGEGEEGEEDLATKHKKMEELRHKLKRAVIKASVITRRPHRQMKSAMPSSMFPFLQDAMFVPMFHFMRDEHGHRAPPVIFDAIRLSVSVSGASAGEEEEHHFVVRIELQYGDVKWVIYRRLNDFLTLHTMLTLRRFQGRVNQLPAFPPQLSYALERARSLKPGHNHNRDERMLQATVDRKQALETYLIKLLRALNMRPAYEVCTFLELSAVSIVKDVGWKGKEGNLDRRVEHTTGMWCTPHDLRRWSRQWVIVRDSYIAFCNHISDPYPSDVLFADPQFDIKFRKKTGQNPLFPYRITVSNQYRRIQLRSDSERIINEWRLSIMEMKSSSAWAVPHRFASFAPIRDLSRVIWFVDGDDYFYAVSEAIENATDCIYIEDWWLSPEIHLRRPYHLNEEYRLDRLLKRKAEEGVKIYIVVYKEVTVSLTINSAYTKRKLQSLHPNIMVQRNPDHLAGGTMFWAHHEKMVVVDNTFAFIGGLDLCWGRYDTHAHRLGDYFLPHKGRSFAHLQIFYGQDYNNARIHDFSNVNDYEETLIDRRTTPRMPWHDVHMAMIGQPARDVARHFIQRWNFVKSSKGMAKPHMPFLMPKGEYSVSRNDLQYRGTCRTQVLRSSAEWSMGIAKESSIHTAYCEMIRDAKHFVYIENQFFISNARDDPGYTIKNRIAEALVDRVKRAHRRGEKFRVVVLMPLMPAFEGDVNAAGAATLKLVMHWQYQAICRGDHSIAAQLEREGIAMHDYIRFFGLRTYDVIRRFADGGHAGYEGVAGNAPLEVPGFDATLKQYGVLPIDRATAPPEAPPQHAAAAVPRALAVELPASAPVPVTASGPSLSFGGAPSASDYSFQRPDEAFASDSFPMQENHARRSQDIPRRSQDIPRRLSREHTTRSNLAGRHSFNLPLKSRSSFSGIRTFLAGHERSGRRTPSSEGSLSSSDGGAASDNETDDDDGRRRNAFRYLVRGTEHRKQFGKKPKGGGAMKLQKRLQKYGGVGGEDRRDSDSEFGSSAMQLDMADVENYVHPPKATLRHRSPESPAFFSDQPGAKPAGRMMLLPEFAGAQYMREIAGGDSLGGLPGPAKPTNGAPHAQAKPAAAYPPPQPRAGPQVLEHEVFGGGKPSLDSPLAARAINRMSVAGAGSQRPPPQLLSRPTAPAALSGGDLLAGRPSVALETGEASELVHVEREVVDQVVTELVYIHCKLMIVDDRYVIMGSANINDRSMVGNRDSEIAMVVEDTEPVVTTMNGRPYQAAKFAHSLRVQLCQEHCGLLDSCDQMRYVNETFAGKPPLDTSRSEAEVAEMQAAKLAMDDPLSDEFEKYWWETATGNEVAFREVFRCVPDDTIETFDQYKKFIPGHDVPHGHIVNGWTPKSALERLKSVRGHLVPIPLNFLKNENLGAKLGDKELLVPVEVFT